MLHLFPTTVADFRRVNGGTISLLVAQLSTSKASHPFFRSAAFLVTCFHHHHFVANATDLGRCFALSKSMFERENTVSVNLENIIAIAV